MSLFGQWPSAETLESNFQIFQSSKVVDNVYLTSMSKVQSLKDLLFDGALLHLFRNRMHHRVVLFTDCKTTDEEYDYIHSLLADVDEFVQVTSIDMLVDDIAKIDGEDVFVCTILLHMAAPHITDNSEDDASTTLQQTLESTYAQKIVNDVCTTFTNSYSLCISYNALVLSDAAWIPTSKAFVLIPHGVMEGLVCTNTNFMISMALQKLDIDLESTDFHHGENTVWMSCALTLYGSTYFKCQSIVGFQQLRIECEEQTLAMSLDTRWPSDARVYDTGGTNLLSTEWKVSEDATVLRQNIRTVLRDLLRRHNETPTFFTTADNSEQPPLEMEIVVTEDMIADDVAQVDGDVTPLDDASPESFTEVPHNDAVKEDTPVVALDVLPPLNEMPKPISDTVSENIEHRAQEVEQDEMRYEVQDQVQDGVEEIVQGREQDEELQKHELKEEQEAIHEKPPPIPDGLAHPSARLLPLPHEAITENVSTDWRLRFPDVYQTGLALLKNVSPGSPVTIFLSDPQSVAVQGILPPTLLNHWIKMGQTVQLLDVDQKPIKMYVDQDSIRIGRARIRIDSYKLESFMASYEEYEKSKSTAKPAERGSVVRLNRRIELNRMMMRR